MSHGFARILRLRNVAVFAVVSGQVRSAGCAQFELSVSRGVFPKSPRFYQRAEGSNVAQSIAGGDPSLRLKNGSAQDDAIKNSK